MHDSIFVLDYVQVDTDNLFDQMSFCWNGVDYVDSDVSFEEAAYRIRYYDDNPNFPEFQNGKIVVTEESRELRKKARLERIKDLAAHIEEKPSNETALSLLLDGEPYDGYICFQECPECLPWHCPSVTTVDVFLRTAEPGIYKITSVVDYHF